MSHGDALSDRLDFMRLGEVARALRGRLAEEFAVERPARQLGS